MKAMTVLHQRSCPYCEGTGYIDRTELAISTFNGSRRYPINPFRELLRPPNLPSGKEGTNIIDVDWMIYKWKDKILDIWEHKNIAMHAKEMGITIHEALNLPLNRLIRGYAEHYTFQRIIDALNSSDKFNEVTFNYLATDSYGPETSNMVLNGDPVRSATELVMIAKRAIPFRRYEF